MNNIFKSILLFILFGAILTTATVLAVPLIPPQFDETFQAALIDKVERLETIDQPKIVLVGTSQLAFGISSDILEQELKMPVVNMGLHGGLSDDFMWDMSLDGIKTGDIVVVSAVDFSLWDSDIELSLITLENYRYLWEKLDQKERNRLLPYYFTVYPSKAVPKLVYNTFLKTPLSLVSEQLLIPSDPAYSRSQFNEYGDNIYPRQTLDYMYTRDFFSVSEVSVSPEYISELLEFKQNVEQQGATFYVITSPIFEKGLQFDVLEAQQYYNEQVPNFISTLSEYIYPIEYFFDTAYHLTNEGADVWTKAIANDLKTAVESGKFY